MRLLVDQLVQLRNDAVVTAEREPCVDQIAPSLAAFGLEAANRLLCEAVVAKLGEGRPTPERQRAREVLLGGRRVARREGVPACRRQPFEHVEIELVRLDAEQVATRSRREPVSAEVPTQS